MFGLGNPEESIQQRGSVCVCVGWVHSVGLERRFVLAEASERKEHLCSWGREPAEQEACRQRTDSAPALPRAGPMSPSVQ